MSFGPDARTIAEAPIPAPAGGGRRNAGRLFAWARRPAARRDVQGRAVGILGGAAAPGHHLQCPAGLAQKLAAACGPSCRTRSIRKPQTEAAIAPQTKSGGAAAGALAARLTLERRLGELLAAIVSPGKRPKHIVVGDDNKSLPEGITRDASSAAQTLAVTPQKWFDKVVEEVVAGVRRLNLKEIYLEAKRVIAGEAADRPPHQAEGIILGDFREVGQEIPDESVALIFTDPPYDRASLELYGEAAKLAKRVLLPGGSLLAYAPNYALPDVIASCREHLAYWWTRAVLHSGSRALMREYGVRVGYKPLVWFTKGGRFNKQQIIEDTVAGDMEKTQHEWQQGVREAEAIIKALTSPVDLVLDPMCGSGTTLLAARRCGRRYWGIEAKVETASLARKRMARKKQ